MKQSTLGTYIRSLRTQNHMTQGQLAEKLNVTDKAVSKWERDLSYPDIALFPKLADILGVHVNDLLRECVDEGQPSRLVQIFEMSQDIRTPLHIILGCADMAANHYDDKELVLRYLQSIRISGEYLLKSIDCISQVMNRMQDGADNTCFEHLGKLEKHIQELSAFHQKYFDSYDFSGKTVVPFATSGSSGMDGIGPRMQKLVPKAKVLKGRRFSSSVSVPDLKEWAGSL